MECELATARNSAEAAAADVAALRDELAEGAAREEAAAAGAAEAAGAQEQLMVRPCPSSSDRLCTENVPVPSSPCRRPPRSVHTPLTVQPPTPAHPPPLLLFLLQVQLREAEAQLEAAANDAQVPYLALI